MKTTQCILLIFLSCISVLAQKTELPREIKDDIHFIRTWDRDQKVKQLAHDLALSADQIATLQNTRAGIDTVKSEFDARIQERQTALGELAHRIRTELEAGGSLVQSDADQLRAIGQELKALHREMRAAMLPVLQGLEGLFTEAQKALIRERIQTWRPDAAGQNSDAAELGTKPRQRIMQGPGQARGPVRVLQEFKEKMAKMVLSDAFLQGATNS